MSVATETYDHPITAAMKRMREFVLARGPALMRAGGFSAGVTQERLTEVQRHALAAHLRIHPEQSYRSVAEQWGCCVEVVSNTAKAHGIVRRRAPVDSAKLAEAVRLVRTEGLEQREACLRTGIRPTTLWRTLQNDSTQPRRQIT